MSSKIMHMLLAVILVHVMPVFVARADNYIANGDFSSGFSGFQSEYLFCEHNTVEGEFTVGSSPASWNGNFPSENAGWRDVSEGTNNLALFVNGSRSSGAVVWRQEVSGLNAGCEYEFRGWVFSLYRISPATLSVQVNGEHVGYAVAAPASPDAGWREFSARFFVSDQSVTVSIVDNNMATIGNDFALDNLSLRSENSILNGDFCDGVVGFYSDYEEASPNVVEGQFSVGADPSLWNGHFPSADAGWEDVSVGADNLALLVNGTGLASNIVWGQEVSGLQAGSDYVFRGWICSLYEISPANLNVSVDGLLVGGSISAPPGPDDGWKEFSVRFSVSTNVVTINLIDSNSARIGNDFAIDNLSIQTAPPVQSEHNLIINGSFCEGNQWFETDYVVEPPPNRTEGACYVIEYPRAWNGNFRIQNDEWSDHSPSADNLSLLVNGSGTDTHACWRQTVPGLQPGVEYSFSGWVATLYSNPCDLRLEVDGVPLGPTFPAPELVSDGWEFFEIRFVANDDDVVLEIFDNNTVWLGNDFALDDLRLTKGAKFVFLKPRVYKQFISFTLKQLTIGMTYTIEGAMNMGKNTEWIPLDTITISGESVNWTINFDEIPEGIKFFRAKGQWLE